jgi:hypothetical protein
MPKSAPAALLCLLAACAHAQMLVDGRVTTTRWPGAAEPMAMSAVLCVATPLGGLAESSAFRTWETEPPGWFRLSGAHGVSTLFFTHPAQFMRPRVLNHFFTRPGEKVLGLRVHPAFEFHSFWEKEWDTKPASAYFQTFTARGRSVTGVGFRVATDGIDGAGPGSQTLVVSVHRRAQGTPDQWPQIGPAAVVPGVDSGGPKNYTWSAGWNSGDVPLVPGETYAVQVRPETPGNTFQSFWRPVADDAPRCFRVGRDHTGFEPRQIWMGISTDNDGLLLPYNKRVQKEYGAFAGFARRWSQTWVAQGRGLAGAVLYAAVGGAQPPLSRQRCAVRVRQGGPDGRTVGIGKIAAGNGNYTGDASWGCFIVAFAPGEVALTPGETYALEFESIESEETLRGFVNIKNQVSDARAGFNPYRKHPRDDYGPGTSFKEGTRQDFDLDMQITEYESGTNHTLPLDEKNFLRNGSFADGAFDDDPAPFAAKWNNAVKPAGDITAWRPFRKNPETILAHLRDADGGFARITGRGKVDGGFVQRLEGLARHDAFRLAGSWRGSYALDFERRIEVGIDPTGQDTDADAPSILWQAGPRLHGQWEKFALDPVRPATNSLSIWLRARANGTEFPFKTDFRDLELRRVRMDGEAP